MTGSLTEQEIAGSIVLRPAGEVLDWMATVQEQIDCIAGEVAVCRELLELVVDWAGARDRIPPADIAEAKAAAAALAHPDD